MASNQTKTSSSGSIPSNYTRLIARELGLQLKGLPKLLRGTGLSVSDIQQEETLLTADQQIAVAHNALRISKDPALGLRVGSRLTPLTHGALGYLAHSSPNLLTAANAIAAFLPTRMSLVRLSVAQTGSHVELHINFTHEVDEPIKRFFCECIGKSFVVTSEFILGRPLEDSQIHLDYPEPEYSGQYHRYLPTKVLFNSTLLCTRIPIALCLEPNASANQENYQLAKRQCEAMLANLECGDESYKTKVQRLILSHPPGSITEDAAAEALFISKRTLARYLKQEGSSFRLVRDEVMSQQAAAYLKEGKLSVDAIATLLNYSDSANFRRAFKRWFGTSPNDYRQQIML
jgi:AraC-like DNA-binding protein